MALPDLIAITPLTRPVRAELSVPGSKSLTNRSLLLAALAEGEVTLEGALWSEDTEVMAACLQEVGFMLTIAPDAVEPCNRRITVYGQGGHVPRGGTPAQPLELFVGNAGTAARFLTAFLCLGEGAYRLHGTPRMHERPQASLFAALRQLGYRIEAPNDRLPALIHGGGRREGACEVSVTESSQFASALLLAARTSGWRVTVRGNNREELPYVRMTEALCASFPVRGGVYPVEPDASSGSYFWGAAWLLGAVHSPLAPSRVTLRNWPTSGLQVDARFPEYLPLPAQVSRQGDLGDSIMTAVVLAAVPALEPSAGSATPPHYRFTDLGCLRLQECERVAALRTELARCGAEITERGDSLEVIPGPLHGAEIETYNDHRMAMGFGILGLKIPGIRLKNPACVKKTFPNFFQKLAAPPPQGLGAELRDGRTGRPLALDELLAQ